MYTAVLMLAVTAGAESVDFGRRGCSCSSYDCSAYSCSGYRGGCGGGYHRSGSCSNSYGCTGVYRTCSSGCHGCSAPVYCHGAVVTTMPARVMVNAPATIVVEVPAAARVTFDGTPTSSTGQRRTFVTPGLDPGASYVYTLRAEVVSNGQPAIETREVIVRAGETSLVRFDSAPQGSAGR